MVAKGKLFLIKISLYQKKALCKRIRFSFALKFNLMPIICMSNMKLYMKGLGLESKSTHTDI